MRLPGYAAGMRVARALGYAPCAGKPEYCRRRNSGEDNLAAQNGIDCAKLGADWASCNQAVITLTNKGSDRQRWAIYFHSTRPTLEVANDQFKVATSRRSAQTGANGQIYRLPGEAGSGNSCC